MVAPNFPILRGLDVQQSRTQDNVSQVLTPVAKALQNTPIMGAPPPAWILPSLINGFSVFGGAYAVPAFHRDALGYVHSKGLVRHVAGVAANVDVFVFPAGYRPREDHLFAVRGTADTIQFARVFSNGSVQFNIAIGAVGDATLEFSFLAEQ